MTSGTKMASGAAWMVAMRMSINLLGVISTIILARLLTPTDYGLVAIATSIVAILEIMSSFSFDLALIHRQDATEEHYNTAWTFNVIFGCTVGLVLALLATQIAEFFSDPRLVAIVYVFAVSSVIKGLANIGVVAFRKQLDFHKEFGYMVATKLIGFVATLILAFVLRNYWALVFGTLIWKSGGVALSYWAHEYRPRLSLSRANELFSFSKWLVATNIMIFIKSKGVDLVLGRMAGSAPLGLYTIAYQISNMPTTELVHPINRAIFPNFAKMSHDPAAIRKGFVDVLGGLALFTVPVAIGLYCVAQPLVDWLLGSKWTDAGPLIQVLALFGLSSGLQANTGSLYLAIGKPKITAYLMAANIVLLFPPFIYGLTHYNIYIASYAVFASSALLMPINYYIIVKLLDLRWRNLLGVLWRPALAAMTMFAVLQYLQPLMAEAHLPTYAQALGLTIIGTVTYASVVVACWILGNKPKGAEQFILNVIVRKLNRGSAQRSTGT